MRFHTPFYAAAILALATFTACGGEAPANGNGITVPVEKIVYVCADGTKLETDSCPPQNPLITVVTEYVCADGTTKASAEACPPVEPTIITETVTVTETVTNTVTVYVCADGSQASAADLCPPGPVTTVTRYVCMDGSVQDALEACVEWCPIGTASVTDEASGKHYCLRTTEVDVTAYVCQDGQRLETDSCPPIEPLVEIVTVTVTKYVCGNGNIVDAPYLCPIPANPRDCPSGQYLDDAGFCQILPSAFTVRRNGATPKAAIVLAGSMDVEVARYSLVASGQDYRLNELGLLNCVGFKEGNANCTEPGETFGSDNAVVRVYAQVLDTNGQPFQTFNGLLQGGRVTWYGMSILVRKGVPTVVRILVDTYPSNAGPIPSGAQFQLNVGSYFAVNAVTGEFAPNGIALADPMTLRQTKPTISLAAGSPSGAAIPGLAEVLRFNVSADSRGRVALSSFTFRLNATDNAGTGWREASRLATNTKWCLVNALESHICLGDVPSAGDPNGAAVFFGANGERATGTVPVVYVAFRLFQAPESIGAGETRTYSLRVDTSGANASQDDSVRIDMPSETETRSLSSHQFNALLWDDGNTNIRVDGSLIRNLPVTGGTMVF